jgi:hypothetical protein
LTNQELWARLSLHDHNDTDGVLAMSERKVVLVTGATGNQAGRWRGRCWGAGIACWH